MNKIIEYLSESDLFPTIKAEPKGVLENTAVIVLFFVILAFWIFTAFLIPAIIVLFWLHDTTSFLIALAIYTGMALLGYLIYKGVI